MVGSDPGPYGAHQTDEPEGANITIMSGVPKQIATKYNFIKKISCFIVNMADIRQAQNKSPNRNWGRKYNVITN
jgi:hypothetical protein